MIQQFATLAGGLGLFLLGMIMLSDGLKLAAGPALERILSNATRTRLNALLSGAMTTVVVQSSSVVTVAVLGFVNAGLLTLGSAIWVVFGANVGTTTTGWIVALAGLKFNIATTALPLIAVGVAMRLSGRQSKVGAYGDAIAGFGILFYGIVLMQSSFIDIAHQWTVPDGTGFVVTLLQALFGVLMTVVMQSSSASTVIAIAAAQAGMIDVTGAAAVVIGANVGTTITAVIAVIGSTPNAKRTASAHVLFNLVTASVGFMLLPWLVPLIVSAVERMGFEEGAAASLALFNTTLKSLGVLVMWPLADRMALMLQGYFQPTVSETGRPQFLDRTTLPVPALAANALGCEIQRMLTMSWRSLGDSLTPDDGGVKRNGDLSSLLHASEVFVDEMARGTMDKETSDRLAQLLRVRRYLENTQESVHEAIVLPLDAFTSSSVAQVYATYRERFEVLVTDQVWHPDRSPRDDLLAGIEEAYQALKAALLHAGAIGEWRIGHMEVALRRISLQRRALQQLVKADHWLRIAL